MRTIGQIHKELCELEPIDLPGQDFQYGVGMQAGFERAMKLVEDGKTNEEIYQYVQDRQRAYVSRGDDDADAYQSGYTTALEWAAERFDWDDEGAPVWRSDVWGDPPEGW